MNDTKKKANVVKHWVDNNNKRIFKINTKSHLRLHPMGGNKKGEWFLPLLWTVMVFSVGHIRINFQRESLHNPYNLGLKVKTSIGNAPISKMKWKLSLPIMWKNMFWLIHDDKKFAGKPPTNSYIW